MKLTKEHILAYLPYNVECSYINLSTGRRIKAFVTGWTKSDGVETTYKKKRDGCVGDLIRFEGHHSLEVLDFKLSLRPAKDLITYIEHNGETFIPLVRLAEIHGWDDSVKIEEQNGTYIVFGDTAIHPGNGETMGRYFFEIDSEDFDIDWGFENVCGGSTFYPVKNQILLYEKLLEWNFDIYKLIDEGLAKKL